MGINWLKKKLVGKFSARLVLDMVNVWLHKGIDIGQGGLRRQEQKSSSRAEQSRARILSPEIEPNLLLSQGIVQPVCCLIRAD